MSMTAIIDYGVGNLFSLCSSLKSIGAEAIVTPDADTIRADASEGGAEGEQIAHSVVNDSGGTHSSSPFVEGMELGSRSSMATASRRLLATDLKVPSMM